MRRSSRYPWSIHVNCIYPKIHRKAKRAYPAKRICPIEKMISHDLFRHEMCVLLQLTQPIKIRRQDHCGTLPFWENLTNYSPNVCTINTAIWAWVREASGQYLSGSAPQPTLWAEPADNWTMLVHELTLSCP